MKHIVILSSSVRQGRLSQRVALFWKQYLEENQLASAEILDLKEYDFPLFDERLAFQKNPSDLLLDFTKRFLAGDGLIIVSPVYNGSFPASLKNVMDLYFKEWHRKPVAITSVSSGLVPPISTTQSIQTLLLKLGALVTPVYHTIINAGTAYDEQGVPQNRAEAEMYAKPVIEELLWLMEK